jgi:threonine synthase
MNVTHLECALCGLRHEAGVLQNLCIECGKPLLVRYDLEKAAQTMTKESLPSRESSLWRYREVLPVSDWNNVVSFGEGWTPLLNAEKLARVAPGNVGSLHKGRGPKSDAEFSRHEG